ncbi:MAG: UDP-N-acetylmuramoyl-L-alanine--D-glutamate ligase [Planctomycetota bacterium]
MITDDDLRGSSITVMGLGRFGGQIAAVRFLAKLGCDILVTDLADEETLRPSIKQIQPLIDAGQVTLRLGGHNVSDFTTCDYVVVSPAVPHPWDNRYLRAAEAAGIPLTTEIRLTVERLPNRLHTIGVTGTAGKSTTAAMIAHVLSDLLEDAGEPRAAGASPRIPSVHLGGNIGTPLIETVGQIREEDWVVLELSSFQLYWLGEFVGSPHDEGWSPHVAVWTNYAPNHIDWHISERLYKQAKRGIVRLDSAQADLIIGDDTAGIASGLPSSRVTKSQQLGQQLIGWLQEDSHLHDCFALRVPGEHNRINAFAALAAIERARGMNREWDRFVNSIATFRGLPHRLQRIDLGDPRDSLDPLLIFNDSKSTTPDATRLAVEAFDDEGWPGASRVVLICGGSDKGSDLAPMVDAATRCAAVFTIGTTGPSLAEAINRQAAGARPRTDPLAISRGTLDEAMTAATGFITTHRRIAYPDLERSPPVLLLSPGCASWDQFTNYEERGDRFITLCHKHFGSSTTDA